MAQARILAVDARLADSSGIGTYITQLVPRLAPQLTGVRLALLGDPATLAPIAQAAGAEVRPCTARLYSLTEQWEVWRALPRGTTALWCPHYVIPLLWRGPLAVTVHDVLHLRMPEMFSGRAKQAMVRAMFGAVRRRADLVLTDSVFTASELRALVGEPRGRLETVHLGVDEEWFGIPDVPRAARPYLLYVGNVKPHKNLVRLLDAFARVAPALPHELRIVGRREGFIAADDEVARRAEALGDRVAFTGRVPDAELRRLYRGASALLFPSLYEGFGFPPLEAMAAGVPAMVARSGSLPEVCGDAALWVDPHDVASIAAGIVAVATDTPLRERLVSAGTARATSFRWDATARRTAELLAPLLGATRPAPAVAHVPHGQVYSRP